MPRIPLVTEASMTDAQRRVYEAMMNGPRRSPPVGPLAAAMHRPDLAEKWSDLGLVLRFNSSFPPRLREFVILLTGRYLGLPVRVVLARGRGAQGRPLRADHRDAASRRPQLRRARRAGHPRLHYRAAARPSRDRRDLPPRPRRLRHRRHRRADRADRLLRDGRADAQRTRDRCARRCHAALARPRRRALAIAP